MEDKKLSDKLKVAVLGSGGIIGQHMHISVPPDVESFFVRKTPSPLATGLDLTDWAATERWLNMVAPDVIVNLAGESRPDVVERHDVAYQNINIGLPCALRGWCQLNGAHLIQVSSQAAIDPVNKYGQQKALVDLLRCEEFETIVRPTFVLGIRPFSAIGRENPAEAILRGDQTEQVNNRWFSVSFAWDVADVIWRAARVRPGVIIHVGNPERLCRYDVARMLNPTGDFHEVTQETLESLWPIAPRPLDTTYVGARFTTPLADGLQMLRGQYNKRATDDLSYRARELAAFLRRPIEDVERKLRTGFGPLHNEVTADFDRASPKTDEELLNWYRTTEAYLWELTAYHCDKGFNYAGMCEGIITRLKMQAKARTIDLTWPPKEPYRVLCLGDGVGTLSIKMKEAGFDVEYHDLRGSRTAAFAQARFAMRGLDIADRTHDGWHPAFEAGAYDAIASLDFLEHVTQVEYWVSVIFGALKPGGLFVAQNGFAMGSGPDGAMPMHLAVNDRFEKDWDPLLSSIGFVQLASNWYQKPEAK